MEVVRAVLPHQSLISGGSLRSLRSYPQTIRPRAPGKEGGWGQLLRRSNMAKIQALMPEVGGT